MASSNDVVFMVQVVLVALATGIISGALTTILIQEIQSDFESIRSWWARREHSKNVYELLEFEDEEEIESLSGVFPVAASDLSDLDSSMLARSDLSDVVDPDEEEQ